MPGKSEDFGQPAATDLEHSGDITERNPMAVAAKRFLSISVKGHEARFFGARVQPPRSVP
jgi:hypothetical protein